MSDERERIPLESQYAHALGVATYCFAVCEWNAVWSAERLQTGYVGTVEPMRKTAGAIATDLLRLVNAMPDQALIAICRPPALEFKRLVEERNGLLHGKPGTAPNGDQRLFRHGQEWSISDVKQFSDQVAACSTMLNEMVHQHLVTP